MRKEIFPSDSYCPKQRQKIQNKKTQMNEAVIQIGMIKRKKRQSGEEKVVGLRSYTFIGQDKKMD